VGPGLAPSARTCNGLPRTVRANSIFIRAAGSQKADSCAANPLDLSAEGGGASISTVGDIPLRPWKEFRFHMTLTGRVADEADASLA